MTERPFVFGGTLRGNSTSQARFAGTTRTVAPRALTRADVSLPSDHWALAQNRSMYPTRVVEPDDAPRLLVSGYNNAKTGAVVEKGPWRGVAIYTLTLEERATCPSSCDLLSECYGNSMPMARRHAHGPALIEGLERELRHLLYIHRRGIAIRLHVLGDFWSLGYAQSWYRWLHDFPRLHVWGYTAHARTTDIGGVLDAANIAWPDRCSIRFSVRPDDDLAHQQATTVWMPAAAAESTVDGIVCPAQTGRTSCCATCALCWAEPAKAQRIVFLGHGRLRRSAAQSPP